MPIPLRSDFTAAQVRAAARKTKDGPQARRLVALAAIYDGGTRSEATKVGGVTLQIVADSVDPDQPFRPIVITRHGDRNHAVHHARGVHGGRHWVAHNRCH